MSLLRALQQAGVLRTLDDALAHTLRRLAPDTSDDVLAAAALASLAVSQGHAGFDPAAPSQFVEADPGSSPGQALPWPEPDAWMRSIAAAPFVATPDTPLQEAEAAPLVFERTAHGHGLLYLRRYREYERRLALQLQRIALDRHPGAGAQHARAIDAAARRPAQTGAAAAPAMSQPPSTHAAIAQLAPLFATLFPDASGGDRQARAAALSLRRALLLVTGGPGTGKTTTIARLLVLRIAQAVHTGAAPPRIALAAPTGRAADRMADSLRRARAQMAAHGVDPALLEALPADASTLHRLLGTLPDVPTFRHHADHPLPFDIVVVDEASMVDLPLMCKLAEAVAPCAQLILLGDADQLPSVEAGDVLAAILAAAGPGDALHPDDAEALQPLLDQSPSLARAARRGGPERGAVDPDPAVDVDRARHPREGGDPASLPSSQQPTPLDSHLRGSDERGRDEQNGELPPLHDTRIDAFDLNRHPREGGDPASLPSSQQPTPPDAHLHGSDVQNSEPPPLHDTRIHAFDLARHPREGGDPASLLLSQQTAPPDSRLHGSDAQSSEPPPLHGTRIHASDPDRHPREGGDPASLPSSQQPTPPDAHRHGSDEQNNAPPSLHDTRIHASDLSRHPREGGDPASLLLSQQPTPPDARLHGSDEQNSEPSPLHGTRIHLHRGWRQDADLHLAPLAEAVRNGDAAQALGLLRGGSLGNVFFHERSDDPLQAHPDLLAHWRTLATHADPARALGAANRLRLLTALREGAQGARTLNERIEAALSGRRIGAPPAWFPGRLLLVTRNSYHHGLFNGDVGICLPDPEGTPLAWFPGTGSDPVRAFHPAALPAHESAFAMTVHKSQGSEFDEVWLQLPRTDSRVLSRELLYTAITRARSVLHVAGSGDVIAAALGRHAGRVSGLGWRLE